jgi:hypothetical protein
MISSEVPAHLVLRPGEENHGRDSSPSTRWATYSGVLTFTATKPVEVGFGHRLHVNNSNLSQFEVEKLGDLYRRHHVNSSEHVHLVSYRFHPVSYLTMESHRPISLPRFHL